MIPLIEEGLITINFVDYELSGRLEELWCLSIDDPDTLWKKLDGYLAYGVELTYASPEHCERYRTLFLLTGESSVYLTRDDSNPLTLRTIEYGDRYLMEQMRNPNVRDMVFKRL